MYVQDFDGEKLDPKILLERKVLEGEELSTDDRLLIIRALEAAGSSIFPNTNNPYNTPNVNFPQLTRTPWLDTTPYVVYNNNDKNQPQFNTICCDAVSSDNANLYTAIKMDASALKANSNYDLTTSEDD